MSNKHILIHSASRDYVADRVFSTGALLYLHTDYQGSVVMVTDSAGTIEQHTSYYPYGEPHRSPAINWPTPDNKASDYAWVSPYSFCAASQIQFIDPDGREHGTREFIPSHSSIPSFR